MSYVRCDCCNRRIRVTADDVGRGTICPRTWMLIGVTMADVRTKATPPRLRTKYKEPLPFPEPRGQTRLLLAGSIAACAFLTGIGLAIGYFFTEADSEVAFTLPWRDSTGFTIPAPPKPQLDSNGFIIHALAKRIDQRSTEELEQDLLAAREVSLDVHSGSQASANLIALAKKQSGSREPGDLVKARLVSHNGPADSQESANRIALAKQFRTREMYVGTIRAAEGRADLAGLPFRTGPETPLGREKAMAMNDLSKQLREAIKTCPNTSVLYARLKGDREQKKWATDKSVPCIQQMLQAENGQVRRMACELLRGLDVPEATEALVKWAVFDTDAGNRAAAVDALRTRDKKDVSRLLMRYVRYPLPRAVEHAAEALVALNCQEAIPQLVAAYDQPDSDSPFKIDLTDKFGGTYRQEIVRVNHLQNCVMCHPPSFQPTDLVRGAIPDPKRPLETQTSGYDRGNDRRGDFIEADVTYLRQDFSVVQPVSNHGIWPERQRYDYFVSIRRENDEPGEAPTTTSPYRQAIRFAIKELSQHDPEADSAWMAEQRKVAVKLEDNRLGDVARFDSLDLNPVALASLKVQEFVQPLLSVTDEDVSNTITTLQNTCGETPARLALIAYLDPLTRTGEPANRAKATRLLAVAMGNTSDANLANAMKNAASGDASRQ